MGWSICTGANEREGLLTPPVMCWTARWNSSRERCKRISVTPVGSLEETYKRFAAAAWFPPPKCPALDSPPPLGHNGSELGAAFILVKAACQWKGVDTG